MDDMRSQYQAEVQRVDEVREAFTTFEKSQKETQVSFTGEFSAAQKTSESEIQELREKLDTLMQKRVLDRKNLEMEVSVLRKRVQDLASGSQGSDGQPSQGGKGGGGGVRLDVVGWMLDSQLMSAAVDLQDDVDRKSVALFGYKDGRSDEKASGACTLPGLDGDKTGTKRTPRKRPAASAGSTGGFGLTDPVYR